MSDGKKVLRTASLEPGDIYPAEAEQVILIRPLQGGVIEVWWLEDER